MSNRSSNEENDLLMTAVQKSGFLFEAEVYSHFKEKGFHVFPNETLSFNHTEFCEIDLLCFSPHLLRQAYIFECKASSKSSKLVLFKQNRNSSYSNLSVKEMFFHSKESKIKVQSFQPNTRSCPLVYTGDFFNPTYSKEELTGFKRQGSHQVGNLFKAKEQLIKSVSVIFENKSISQNLINSFNISEDNSDPYFQIFPVILTNTDIFIYGDDKTLTEINYAALSNNTGFESNSLIIDNKTNWKLSNNNSDIKQRDRKLDFVWVVNFNFIEDFLDTKKTYF